MVGVVMKFSKTMAQSKRLEAAGVPLRKQVTEA
jgi:hypothetical protein